MALPLSDMLTLARGDDTDKILRNLRTQQYEAATYLLKHAEDLLLDETVTGRVIVAELAVFQTRPGDDQDRQFATFAAARAEEQLESYLKCIKAIQTITENGGPLVLMDDFYSHKEAFLSTHKPKASSGRQAEVSNAVGKFDTAQIQLSDKDRQALKRIPPKKRFDYFAKMVANDVCAEQRLSIAAVTLDCRHPGQASNIRASLFVVLGHEGDQSTGDDRLRSLISQRTYMLLGSLVAGNLVESWADLDNSPSGRAKGRILPQGDPRALGYKGADFKAFFQDHGGGPQGGPPHDLDPSSELHHDVRHYFVQIFASHCQNSTEISRAESAVDEWAKREYQAHEMHDLMKRIFLCKSDLTFNWLPVLAASCLKLDTFVSDSSPTIKLFPEAKKLSKLSGDQRIEFVEALLEFFVALRPKDGNAHERFEVKCGPKSFNIKVRPFNAHKAAQHRVPLVEKLLYKVLAPESHTGNLIDSIDKINRYLRLSGLPMHKESKQLCVFDVIPSAEADNPQVCEFEFRSVESTPGEVA